MIIASVSDFREAARRRLPNFLFDYIEGGSFDEVTVRRNVEDLAQVQLRQRVLRDVSGLDLSCELFGQAFAMPVALAPVGFGGLFARRGECLAVRSAEKAGVAFSLSNVAACSIAEVHAAANMPFWYQLYMLKDRGFVRDTIARARDAQCSALLFTVDLPFPGRRRRDYRTGMLGQGTPHAALRRMASIASRWHWAWNVGLRGRPHTLGNIEPVVGEKKRIVDYLGWTAQNFDHSVTWRDLEFVRKEWPGPLIIKGILDPDDAAEAADLGAQGIVVSNHGGRQLDGAPSTAQALPPIADRVGDRLTVLADGGVRSGLDVIRMLALGAHGAMIGRPWAWALAARGEQGVSDLLAMIADEMHATMGMMGVKSVAEIDRSVLA
ncbi:MAG: L-lactate dehydrogenase [Novosphingobium sp.]